MYSPKVDEKLIPILFRLAKSQKKPMTVIVNSMIRESVAGYDAGKTTHCAVCGELGRKKEMEKVRVKVRSGKVITILICHSCYEK